MTEADPKHPEADQNEIHSVELWVSRLLLIGVLMSLALVVAGTVISFIHHPGYFNDTPALSQLIQKGATFPHTLREVIAGIASFQGQSLVVLGLLLLIATPVLRVAMTIVAFTLLNDRYFVAITTIVLLMLILSFVLGLVLKTAPV